jgi:hypothetical protein
VTAVLMRRALLRRHRRAAIVAACLWFLSPSPSGLAAPEGQAPAAARDPGTLTIEHRAPGCLAAGRHARLAACFRPEAALARARLYFRAGGTRDWFYVDMSGTPPCLEGVLPRPKKSVKQVEYYVAAIDRASAESRTPEHVLPVTDDGQCPAGPVAPVADAASAVIGSASGAAPAGFVTGGGLSPLLIAGGAAVIAGGAAAVVAGGGGEDNPPTTTLPPTTTTTTTSSTTTSTTTTTTTTLRPTPTTTTTTTTLAPCETQAPTVGITNPSQAQVTEPTQITITADASDPSPGSGVKEVRFYWQYCPLGNCGTQNLLAADTTAPYSAVWVFPSCGSMPEDRYAIRARAEDKCGNVSPDSKVDVRLTGRGCFRGATHSRATGTWVSELSVAGGRGQVVVDGTEAVFPAGGQETFSVPTGPGTHRFEATLVDATGRPDTWRFDLEALRPVPGSLRVVAGEAAVAGSAAAVFRLRGKPGERVVFTVDVGGRQ